MENASKALIIAGAILLSILIIGLGMSVYNNATSATGSANLDAQEVQAHNAQFLSYEGRQKGSNVKALVNMIKSNNAEYTDRIIAIGFSNTTSAASVSASDIDADGTDPNEYNYSIKTNTTYFVTFDYGTNGCINTAEIHVYSDSDLTGE